MLHPRIMRPTLLLVALVIALIAPGCRVTYRGRSLADARHALVNALRDGDIAEAQRLAAAGLDLDSPLGENGWTPLLHAIHVRRSESVALLLQHGADADRASASGAITPLVLAASYGDAPIVKKLLAAGANPRRRTSKGVSPLEAAVRGSTDLDVFTLGRCQTATVKAVLSAAPDEKLESAAARWLAHLGGCSEVLRLIS